MMLDMRTTVTLDADVERLVKEAMRRKGGTFKDVVNQAIRKGLSPSGASERIRPYRVAPHHGRLLPGYDRRGFNKLVDELEDAAVVAKIERDRTKK